MATVFTGSSENISKMLCIWSTVTDVRVNARGGQSCQTGGGKVSGQCAQLTLTTADDPLLDS